MNFKSLLFFLVHFIFYFSLGSVYSQDTKTVKTDTTENTVPIAKLEQLPYPKDCAVYLDNPVQMKNCLTDFISQHVSKHFKLKKFKNFDTGKYRVAVQFKIDKMGYVTGVKARGTATEIENEAIRVVKKLPKMTPGIQDGENVTVLYGLPINFIIPKTKKN